MVPITIKKDGEFNNRFGTYKHNDIIGKEFGSKVNRGECVNVWILNKRVDGFVQLQRFCLFASPNT